MSAPPCRSAAPRVVAAEPVSIHGPVSDGAPAKPAKRGTGMHLLKFNPSKLSITARKNRQELIKSRLTRRDLMQLGLLTSAGYLIPKAGLSAWASGGCDECDLGCSPPIHRFVDPLPVPPV